MSDTLCGLIGRDSSFEVEIVPDRTLGLAAISVRYLSARNPTIPKLDLMRVGKLAIDEYSKSSANSFTDGLSIDHRNPGVITSVKPLEYYRWTLESAFSDSQQIMKAVSEGGNE